MTREEMREKVSALAAQSLIDGTAIDAAIALVLDEAEARVKETLDEHGDPLATDRALRAIRTLKERTET